MRRTITALFIAALLALPAVPASAVPTKITHTLNHCEPRTSDGGFTCRGWVRGVRADDFDEARDKAILHMYRAGRRQGVYLTGFGGTGHQLERFGTKWDFRLLRVSYRPEPAPEMEKIISDIVNGTRPGFRAA